MGLFLCFYICIWIRGLGWRMLTAVLGCSRIKSSPRVEWEVQGVMWAGLYSVVVWKSSFFTWREALLIAEIKSNRKASSVVLLSHFLPLPPTLSLSLSVTSLNSFSQLFFCCPLWPPIPLSLYFHYFSLFIHLPLSLGWSKAEQELLQHSTSLENQLQGMERGLGDALAGALLWYLQKGQSVKIYRERGQVKKKVVQCCAM